MSIVAIADLLAVHPNTVRFHLDGLVGLQPFQHLEAPLDRQQLTLPAGDRS